MSTQATPLTEQRLANIMASAMVLRESVVDLNDCKQTGIYRMYTECLNKPDGANIGSVMICLRWDQGRTYQVVLYLGGIAYRIMNGIDAWGHWHKLTDTLLT